MGLKTQRGDFLIDCAMKASAWQRAKGALRELASIQGSYVPDRDTGTAKYERLHDRVEEFIRSIEDDGLQE